MIPNAEKLLTAAMHALRSYLYGNGSIDLAKSVADDIEKALAASANRPAGLRELRDR